MVISSGSLYAFMAESLLSLVWCFRVLVDCMWIQASNSSFFPEINFISKCVTYSGSLDRLLYSISNANSRIILRRMRDSRIFVDICEDNEKLRYIEINVDERIGDLVSESIYN